MPWKAFWDGFWNKWFPQETLAEVKVDRSLWEQRYKQEVQRREEVGEAKGVVEGFLTVEREKREKAEIQLAEVTVGLNEERASWEERYSKEVERRERVERAKGVVEGLLRVEQTKTEKAEKELADVEGACALWKDRYEGEVGRRNEVENMNATTEALLQVEIKRVVEAETSQARWMGLWQRECERAQDMQEAKREGFWGKIQNF